MGRSSWAAVSPSTLGQVGLAIAVEVGHGHGQRLHAGGEGALGDEEAGKCALFEGLQPGSEAAGGTPSARPPGPGGPSRCCHGCDLSNVASEGKREARNQGDSPEKAQEGDASIRDKRA